MTATLTLDADRSDQVTSLGGPQGQGFELELFGSSSKTPSGQQANVLVVVSGVAIPMWENLDDQGLEHDLDLRIETEYRLRQHDEFCDGIAYITLASIDNDDEVDEVGYGLAGVTVTTVQASHEAARVVVEMSPIGLVGDATLNRVSYQAYVTLYRPPQAQTPSAVGRKRNTQRPRPRALMGNL